MTTDLIVQKAWPHGNVHFKLAYKEGGFQKLAEYLTKETKERNEEKEIKAYSCSRNLISPKLDVKEYKRRKVPSEPKPSKGFYIVPESIVRGVNPFNGLSYLKYIELRL